MTSGRSGPGKSRVERASKIGRRTVRQLIERTGYDVRRAGATVGAIDALAALTKSFECSLVLDVGANRGEFAEAMRTRGYEGQIVSFEPRMDAFHELRKRSAADPKWHALQLALGADPREIDINVSQNGVSSSILPMKRLHLETAPNSSYVGSERVRQVRLDDVDLGFSPTTNRLALKIDVQGYEQQVLAGATDLIGRAAAVQVELSLGAVYESQADWKQMTAGLMELGFSPWAIEPVLGDRETGQTLQVDLVLARL